LTAVRGTMTCLLLTDINIPSRMHTSTSINLAGDHMARVQLALNVADLDEAIDFYSKLFATSPAKVRPGYANFAVADPPLKLVLIEHPETRGSGVVGALNHLGVEVMSPGEVSEASGRLSGEGLATVDQEQTTCCFAVQDKVWVEDPDGAPWEVYTVLADAPVESGIAGDGTCCVAEGLEAASSGTTASSCC
jgi:catechol 2,3-dioxygenase-like lactoylglutathione lyase family enzyme